MSNVLKLSRMLKDDEAFIVLKPENRYYFSHFESSNALVLVTKTKSWFFTDFRYITAAKEKVCPDMEVVLQSGKSFPDLARERIGSVKKMFFEQDTISYSAARSYMDKFPEAEFVSGDRMILDLRMIKQPEELEMMKKAQTITDAGFDFLCGYIHEHKNRLTEKELAFELEVFMKRNGSGNLSFDTIVASGPNGALPHAVPCDRVISDGDLVTIDFGASFGGYCSDMTRTVGVGSVSDEQKKIYDTVLQAQLNALKNLRSGITGKEGDSFARDIINAAGYGQYFGHSLGHSVGLQIHEDPRCSQSYTEILPSGVIMTVEPGIYIEGFCGVRIEDMVLLKEDGLDNFTHSKKELILL